MLKQIKCIIKGETPLLMHRFPLEKIEALENKSIEEQAEIAAYRDAETQELYVPGIAFQRALIAGAVFSKGKGRSSLQKSAAACLMIKPERISLGTKKYEIDIRPVVVPATRGRINRARPRLDEWKLNLEIEYDDVLLTESQVRKIVDDTGKRVGILDFRPEKKGYFGRFIVVHWE